MSDKYTETHWSIKFWIALLIGMNLVHGYQLNQTTRHTADNACLIAVMAKSEYGRDQHKADQDYNEWRQGVVDNLVACLEGYE